MPFYGAITACIDNPLLKAILPRVRRRVFTYGTDPEADYRLEFLASATESPNASFEIRFARFLVHTATGPLGPFELHVPGRHNVLNATAAVAIARQLEVPADKIAEGLNHFRGVDRRFQLRGTARGVTVVDDYGHHPTEIRATLAAARECGHRKIHVVFQPHRYSRTLDLMDQFAGAFTDADTVMRPPHLRRQRRAHPRRNRRKPRRKNPGPHAQFVPDFPSAVSAVAAHAQSGDLILTLGAGNVSQLAPQILAALEQA